MFKKLKSLLLVGVLAIGTVGCGSTKEAKEDAYKVCLVLSEGGVNDESFNQSAYEGALKAQEEYGIELSYLESKSTSEYMQNIETAIDKESDLVVGVGFQMADAIKEAALAYPEQNFVIIDSTYEDIPSNLRPITFNEQEAGYAVGIIASQLTKTNACAFLGGVEIPSCYNFGIGFEQALKDENKDIKFVKQFTNSFTDSAKAKVVAEQMINDGVDTIFFASGGGNVGAVEAIKEKGVMGIGVDMPSNYLAPQYVITSALKNVGEGLKLTIKDAIDGNFNGGNEVKYDLSNGGVGYEKTNLLSDELIQYVEERLKEYENRN